MRVKLKPTNMIVLNLGLEPNGRVQRFFTNTCALHIDKYVPFDTGALAETSVLEGGAINKRNVHDNYIVYNQPYARYVYYGISRSGKPMKYHKDKHLLAGKEWDKRMWSAEKGQITREVQKFVERG